MNSPLRLHNIRRGFTMLETLVSLTIVAALMASMAAAMMTAGSAVEMNDRFFRSVQQARAAETYITTEIRRASAIGAVSSTSINITTPDLPSGATIAYNSSTQQITLTPNGGTASVLAGNVSAATFASVWGTNLGGSSAISAISLTLTIQFEQNQITLSDSAAPRANITALYE